MEMSIKEFNPMLFMVVTDKDDFPIVKIPKSLKDKLEPFGARYLKVSRPILGNPKTGKAAVEHDFPNHLYKANDPKLLKHLAAGGNYGIMGGKGLGFIDLDQEELIKRFEARIHTFTVQSGSGKGRHPIIRTDIKENGALYSIIPDKNGKRENIGNIQIHNKYIVAAGSNHFSGGKYKVIKDDPIAWVTKKDLEEIFGEQLVWAGEQNEFNKEHAKTETKQLGLEIPIEKIVDLTRLKQRTADEWQGEHPIHGSTTGANFCVNTDENVWHCFRCNSGGGSLSWIAVQEELIQCEDARKGALKGKLFIKTLEIAKEEGYIESFDDYFPIKEELQKYFEGKPLRFVPPRLAEDIMKEFIYVTRKADKTIFIYQPQRGIYTQDGEIHIKRQVQKILKEESRINRKREVVEYIKDATTRDIKKVPIHLIAVKNGIYDINEKKLKPFSPEYFITNALPIYYDAKGKCPTVEKFISEIVEPEDVPILQEMCGYTLYKACPFDKSFILIGEGANGKSTFLELLNYMLGTQNIVSISLQTLTSPFSKAALYGKLANIYPDLSSRALKDTGLFKMLVSGEMVTAEIKFKDPFNFYNYAKLIFSANWMPQTLDNTTAFFRRWVIINFPNQFLPENPQTDPNLIDKITTKEELSGFFNWAIEGLERLLKNEKFSISKTTDETRQHYIKISDSAKAYIEECLEQTTGIHTPKNENYDTFIKYCKTNKLPTVAKNVLSVKMMENLPGLTEIRKKIEGKTTRCWRDLAIQVNTGNALRGVSTIDEITLSPVSSSIEKGDSDGTDGTVSPNFKEKMKKLKISKWKELNKKEENK